MQYREMSRKGELAAPRIFVYPMFGRAKNAEEARARIRQLKESGADGVKFSAPFLDNTLAKMLALQNRLLKTGSEIAASDASEEVKREQFEQSAELSRIIALICAEKARQGA